MGQESEREIPAFPLDPPQAWMIRESSLEARLGWGQSWKKNFQGLFETES